MLLQKIQSLINNIKETLFPTPIERSESEQQVVDQQAQSMSLYHFPGCPYCLKVRRVIYRLALKIELKDARNDPDFRNELITHGGKNQAPCLKIIQTDGQIQWLYESDAINKLLSQRFG